MSHDEGSVNHERCLFCGWLVAPTPLALSVSVKERHAAQVRSEGISAARFPGGRSHPSRPPHPRCALEPPGLSSALAGHANHHVIRILQPLVSHSVLIVSTCPVTRVFTDPCFFTCPVWLPY